MLTQEKVKELFDYREDGSLIWKTKRNKGLVAGGLHKISGYFRTRCGRGAQIPVHRIVFLWHHGYLPKMIDHIDRDPQNNRIKNLRECTHQQNMFNRVANANTETRHKGIERTKGGRWMARYRHNKKSYRAGTFNTEEEAARAHDDAVRELHGEFFRPNIIEGAE